MPSGSRYGLLIEELNRDRACTFSLHPKIGFTGIFPVAWVRPDVHPRDPLMRISFCTKRGFERVGPKTYRIDLARAKLSGHST
jgi:hypothetical protein